MSSFTYVVGASRRLTEQEYRPVSFRLSRIKKVSQRKYSPYEDKVFYKEDIDKLISERGVQFLAGDCIQATIQFTEEGLNKFNRFIALRPRPLPFTDDDRKARIMKFEATPYQLEAYFFKFGADAVILEPLELRDRILNNYKKAVISYAQNI